jgi:environmental stress-induced protein Ves
MSLPSIVFLDQCAPQPWRNGGGVTRELLAWPIGASDWQLRVSVADIDRSGPFSAYAGVDRWFTVLEGAGVELTLPDGPQRLWPGSAALFFPGEAAPGCELLQGRTRDLNLMHRRGQGRARLQRAQAPSTLDAPCAWRALYSHGAAQLLVGGRKVGLTGAALLWCEAPNEPWHLVAGREAWWMELFA